MHNPSALFDFTHYVDPKLKDSKWAAKAVQELYQFGGAESLLAGKNPEEIRKMVTGSQSVRRYKKMFRRMANDINRMELETNTSEFSGIKDITGIDWMPLAVLATPMNSAITTVQKTPLYVKCTAIDSLAQDKKQRDYEFMRHRPFLDQANQEISDMMGVPISSPTTENNSENVDIANFDLDPTKEDELNFFMNMFYRLRPESAFETSLLSLGYILGLKKVQDLEAKDQFYYGVSANRAYFSDITGLMMVEYVYPGDIHTPHSNLVDFSDAPFRYISKWFSAEEVMNAFSSELDTEQVIGLFDKYFMAQGYGFKWKTLDTYRRRRMKIPLIYMEFKSWDIERYHKKKSRAGFMITEMVDYSYELRYSQNHPSRELRGKPKMPTEEEFIRSKYVQNTYTCYWFPSDPDNVYKYKKLEGSYRKSGQESMSPFSINIHKSQDKGSAEICEPIVHDINRSYFKLQHCVIMSKPKGMFLDMRYMRNAVTQMASGATDFKLTMSQVMSLLAENNIMLGDSEGIDPTEQLSGSRPFYEIAGGIGQEISGYLEVINDGMNKIGRLTGINEAITGTGNGSNPEGLVGVQKLLLQSGVNSIYYAQVARKEQSEKVYHMWANLVQHILKHRNTASYKAMEAIIGSYKVAVLEDLHTIPSHMFSIKVENAPNEAEQAELNEVLLQMFTTERITSADFITLRRVFNYKDAQQLLAIRERKNQEKRMQEQQMASQSMLAAEQTRAQAKAATAGIAAQGTVKAAEIKSETEKWIATFQAKVDEALAKINGAVKGALQEARGHQQLTKAERMANISNQKPL